MTALITALLLVPLVDQGVKAMLRERLGAGEWSLGLLGSVRLSDSRIWAARLARRSDPRLIWTLWSAPALVLTLTTLVLPAFGASAGLLLGGSLSHAVESAWRGGVTDYVHWRFWPAFNLADVAITGGAMGLAAQSTMAVIGWIA